MNKDPGLLTRVPRRRVVAGVALALVATGCTGHKAGKSKETSPSPTATAATASFIVATANYDGYRKDHKCDGGTPRPCGEPLSTMPDPPYPLTTQEVINAINPDGSISWPKEGIPIKVVCQVQGKEVKYYYQKPTNVVDVVEAPADSSHINQDALSSLLEMHPEWKAVYGAEHQIDKFVMPDGEEGYAFAYAVGAAIARGKIFPQLAECSAEQNPLGAPPVH